MTRYQPEIIDKNSSFAFFFLCLYTLSVLIRPHEMSYATSQWVLIKTFAIICLIITLIAQRPLQLTYQHWMLFFLAPLIILSGFVNGSGMIGITQANKFIAASLIPLFLFSNCVSSIKRQHWMMIICITAALIMVHNGHTQQTNIQGAGWAFDTFSVGFEVRRITYLGIFNDPNDIGMFLVMNIPFVIYFIHKGNFLSKLIMLCVLSAIIYGIYITHSRGTALGALSLIAIYYIVVKAGTRIILAAFALAPVALVALLYLQSNVDESAMGRLEAWYEGITMLKSYPFGIGKGSFTDVHGLTAHNSYVLIAGELGIIGYTLWGGALLLTVLTGSLFIRNVSRDGLSQEIKEELAINKTLFFSMVGFLITAFFLSRSYAVLLFIFSGMTIASHHRLIKLMPELSQYYNFTLAKKCMLYCWGMILLVYVALKITL